MFANAIAIGVFLCAFCHLAAYEFAIATMFRNEAPYLKEWVEYHFHAGVDHFWLYDNNSQDNWKEVLQPYIDRGLVEVIDWPSPEVGPDYVPFQLTAFKDAITRAQSKAKWIAIIDIDEFLLPMRGRSIPECVNNFFGRASGIYVNWRNFGTGGVSVPPGETLLNHLTAASHTWHPHNTIGKSIVRPEAVAIDRIWYPHHFPLLRGLYVDGSLKKMPGKGDDMWTDGNHHDHFIRINHYILRDENFYRNVRLERANRGFGDKRLLLEHYDSFTKTEDRTILEYIDQNFPEDAKALWGRS